MATTETTGNLSWTFSTMLKCAFKVVTRMAWSLSWTLAVIRFSYTKAWWPFLLVTTLHFSQKVSRSVCAIAHGLELYPVVFEYVGQHRHCCSRCKRYYWLCGSFLWEGKERKFFFMERGISSATFTECQNIKDPQGNGQLSLFSFPCSYNLVFYNNFRILLYPNVPCFLRPYLPCSLWHLLRRCRAWGTEPRRLAEQSISTLSDKKLRWQELECCLPISTTEK